MTKEIHVIHGLTETDGESKVYKVVCVTPQRWKDFKKQIQDISLVKLEPFLSDFFSQQETLSHYNDNIEDIIFNIH